METFGYDAWPTDQLMYEAGRLRGERDQLRERITSAQNAVEMGRRAFRRGFAQTGAGIALLGVSVLAGITNVWGIIGFFGGCQLQLSFRKREP